MDLNAFWKEVDSKNYREVYAFGKYSDGYRKVMKLGDALALFGDRLAEAAIPRQEFALPNKIAAAALGLPLEGDIFLMRPEAALACVLEGRSGLRGFGGNAPFALHLPTLFAHFPPFREIWRANRPERLAIRELFRAAMFENGNFIGPDATNALAGQLPEQIADRIFSMVSHWQEG